MSNKVVPGVLAALLAAGVATADGVERGAALTSADIAIDLFTEPPMSSMSVDINALVGNTDPGVVVAVTGLAWDVTIETFGLSWLSEAGLSFSSDTGPVPRLNPGFADMFAGTGSYTDGPIDLSTVGFSNIVNADGELVITAFETFNDSSASPDARITGTITVWTDFPGPPTACSGADQALPFQVLDLNDVDSFVTSYLDEDLAADLAMPHGLLDLNDIDSFVTQFTQGCP